MRYIIGLLITLGLIVFVLFLILSGGSTPATKPIDVRTYATDPTARAQLIVDGPVNSETDHQEVEIDVTSSQVSMTVYRGYQRTIAGSKTYANNLNAFGEFMYSLEQAGFSLGNNDKSLSDDRGYCSAGNRYQYTLDQNDNPLFSYWSTTCGVKTFKGDSGTVVLLFQQQIPQNDYDALTENLNFSL